MKTVSLIFLLAAAAQAQQPAFEVASVRQSAPESLLESYVPTLNVAPGTTLRIQNRQLKELIMIAYGIGGRQLAGPQWLIDPPGRASEIPRFDIVARVPSNAKRDQIPVMLQNLLAERFKLRLHREERQTSLYALEVAKGGLKIQPVTQDVSGGDAAGRDSGCARTMFGADGITTATCRNMTPAQLAQQLQTLSPAYFREGPIVDKTGLTDAYTFSLNWITLQQRDDGQDGPSMYDAVERLGLHIERRKGSAEVLVVDSVEQMPTDN